MRLWINSTSSCLTQYCCIPSLPVNRPTFISCHYCTTIQAHRHLSTASHYLHSSTSHNMHFHHPSIFNPPLTMYWSRTQHAILDWSLARVLLQIDREADNLLNSSHGLTWRTAADHKLLWHAILDWSLIQAYSLALWGCYYQGQILPIVEVHAMDKLVFTKRWDFAFLS